MKKAVFVAAVLMLAPLPTLSQEAQRPEGREPANVEKSGGRDAQSEQPSGQLRSELRDRMANAIEVIQGACADDIDEFCARVTPGGGRLVQCMRAYEDQFSSRCQAALDRVSSAVERSAGRITEMCWNEVRQLCGDADGMAQCVAQKKASLSPACETIVTILGQRVQGLMARVGMPVYGSDDKALGQVAQVVRGPDGKVQSIQVDIGRMLGLGSKVVAINADKFEQLAGIKLRLSEAEIRSLPEAKK
jgi:PRC-barrel domain/Cysteine rich repeat